MKWVAGFFPRGRSVKLTIHFHLAPKLTDGVIPPLPIHLHAIVFKYRAGLRTGWSEVRFSAGVGNFSFHNRVQTGSGVHPAPYPVGTDAASLVVKRPVHETDHSPPSSAEVKNAWSCTSASQYAFLSWCPVKKKHRDKFTFTFCLMSSWSGTYLRRGITLLTPCVNWVALCWRHTTGSTHFILLRSIHVPCFCLSVGKTITRSVSTDLLHS
jgi:hypothetical protein